MRSIFILTEATDPHADKVIEYLRQADCYIFRANRDRYGIEWSVELRGCDVYFINHTDNQELREFSSAWIRRKITKPLFYAVTGYDNLTNDFLTNQNYHLALCSLQAIVARRVMNPVASNEYANSKLNHLKIFNSVGISTPKSLISSSDSHLKQFLREIDGPLALKQVHSDVVISEDEKTILVQMTKKIERNDFDKLIPIGAAAMYFQEYIEKKFEYRVTTVGNKILGVE